MSDPTCSVCGKNSSQLSKEFLEEMGISNRRVDASLVGACPKCGKSFCLKHATTAAHKKNGETFSVCPAHHKHLIFPGEKAENVGCLKELLSYGARVGILLVIAGIFLGGITILSSRAGYGDKATFNTGIFVMGLFPLIIGILLIGIWWFVSKPSTNYQRIAEPVLSCGAQLGILLVIAGIIFGGITILSSRAGNGDKATFNTGVFVMGLFPFIMGVGLIGIDWFGRRSHALIILHDASSGKTEALEKIDNRAAKATVTCTRCHQPLERVDMSRGAMTVGSNLPTLYAGVICNKCGKVECSNCKGSPVDKPCSWCGGAVSPAYEHLLSN